MNIDIDKHIKETRVTEALTVEEEKIHTEIREEIRKTNKKISEIQVMIFF
jgi:hypothetical protein